jgi:hypothetical protein
MIFGYLMDWGVMSYDLESAELNRMAGGAAAPRLMDEVRRVSRVRHYSIRTEAVYGMDPPLHSDQGQAASPRY